MNGKISILFVCLGNICRSPSAEAVMKSIVDKEGLGHLFFIDSAGVAAYHSGEPADARMKQHAQKRGYELTSISRKVNAGVDFDAFDYIIAMDDQNLLDLKAVAPSKDGLKKISKITDYATSTCYKIIPDPYYGGYEGFELVLDLLEESCSGLLLQLKRDRRV